MNRLILLLNFLGSINAIWFLKQLLQNIFDRVSRILKKQRIYHVDKIISRFEDKFKCSSRFRIHSMVQVIHKYISGFLNTEGGTLFYGVRDDGLVQGIKLSRRQRDQLLCALDFCLNNFRPHISSDYVKMEFIEGTGEDEKLLRICM
jgi:hypothetical protein